jgi:predicted nucleic-acid-binding Zn-ribbon protein
MREARERPKCPKCGHTKFTSQTVVKPRAIPDPNQILQCVSCGAAVGTYKEVMGAGLEQIKKRVQAKWEDPKNVEELRQKYRAATGKEPSW